MNPTRQWLTPLGLAMVALVVITSAFGGPGFADVGDGLLNLISALVFAGAAVPFLIKERLPPAVFLQLTVLMGLGVLGMRLADPTGEVLALFLLAAFAPLRPPRPALAAVTLLAALAFNVLQLSTGHSALTLILATDAGAAFFFLVGTLLRREKEQRLQIAGLLHELEASREAERAASVAAERGRMAREVHDVLAHTLSGLVLHLEGARLLASSTGADERLLKAVTRAHSLSKSGLTEARQAVQALRGDTAPGPEMIRSLIEQHKLASAGETRYTVHGAPVPLSDEAAVALYRTVQEALSNVRKHASGADVDADLTWGEDRVDLKISNAVTIGRSSHSGRGFGLKGMVERAELAGGTAETSLTDDRFHVSLSLPIKAGAR
ncbi:signal transduction histidine kinase [Pseudarthrobacter defluvii]|uniref:sensor histidine kinase n=1 Tax=Pseudarthrobacter defluvii TaxID=410837 RepID=UPI002782D43A|nr:histidine kinase [Pseudarthrobacter defluvii]MDQ0769410.1 signal transduction histidine kinase [Pseudarthrobacter defluvii]